MIVSENNAGLTQYQVDEIRTYLLSEHSKEIRKRTIQYSETLLNVLRILKTLSESNTATAGNSQKQQLERFTKFSSQIKNIVDILPDSPLLNEELNKIKQAVSQALVNFLPKWRRGTGAGSKYKLDNLGNMLRTDARYITHDDCVNQLSPIYCLEIIYHLALDQLKKVPCPPSAVKINPNDNIPAFVLNNIERNHHRLQAKQIPSNRFIVCFEAFINNLNLNGSGNEIELMHLKFLECCRASNEFALQTLIPCIEDAEDEYLCFASAHWHDEEKKNLNTNESSEENSQKLKRHETQS